MPRKTIVVMIAAAAVLMAAAPQPASAQGGPDRRPIQIYADLGYVNLFSYPKWFNLGPEVEFRLGRYFSLNPEVSLWVGQSFSRRVKVVPGATANVRLGRFLVGGGVIYRISDWPENESFAAIDRGWLLPKAQVGYFAGPTRLTFSVLFVGGANDIAAALTIGMGFGRPSRD
jgi:hypothetical protein